MYDGLLVWSHPIAAFNISPFLYMLVNINILLSDLCATLGAEE